MIKCVDLPTEESVGRLDILGLCKAIGKKIGYSITGL